MEQEYGGFTESDLLNLEWFLENEISDPNLIDVGLPNPENVAVDEKKASDLVDDTSLLILKETKSKETKEGIGSIIANYKLSDIYRRQGSQKSFFTGSGRVLLQKIYSYIIDKNFDVDDMITELNLLNSSQMDFLIRLLNINSSSFKKSDNINLILKHLLNKGYIKEGSLGKREISGTLPRNTKKKKTEEFQTLSPDTENVVNELRLYIDNLSGKQLLKPDPSISNQMIITTYGESLLNKVKTTFTIYKLSLQEIRNVLSNLPMKTTYKIYQVIYRDSPHYSQKIMNQKLIPQLAQELNKF